MQSAIYSQSILSFLKLLVLRFNWKCLRIEGVQFYPISLSFLLGKELAVVEGGLFNLLNSYIHWGESEQQNGKGMKCPLPTHWPTDLLTQGIRMGELRLMRFLSNSKCPSGVSLEAITWESSPVSITEYGRCLWAGFSLCVCVCVFVFFVGHCWLFIPYLKLGDEMTTKETR